MKITRSEFEILNLSEVPIVNTSDEDLGELEEELGSGLVVNPNGHYERFDEIDLDEEVGVDKNIDAIDNVNCPPLGGGGGGGGGGGE